MSENLCGELVPTVPSIGVDGRARGNIPSRLAASIPQPLRAGPLVAHPSALDSHALARRFRGKGLCCGQGRTPRDEEGRCRTSETQDCRGRGAHIRGRRFHRLHSERHPHRLRSSGGGYPGRSIGWPPHSFHEAQPPAQAGKRRDPSHREQICTSCVPASAEDLILHGATRCLSTRSKPFSRSSPPQHWCGSFGGEESPTSRYGPVAYECTCAIVVKHGPCSLLVYRE